jgi:hypothetical protein
MTPRTKQLSRRNFLLTVGAGGAATAAALTARRVPQMQPEPGQGKRATRGYQASEHVDTYYRTAKI